MDSAQGLCHAKECEDKSLGLEAWEGRRNATFEDFNFLGKIRKGAPVAEVLLAEAKVSKQLYAIKIMKKEIVIENNEVNFVKTEKDVLFMATNESHPFVARIYSTFQTETRLYFVLEYIQGGDLMLRTQTGTAQPV